MTVLFHSSELVMIRALRGLATQDTGAAPVAAPAGLQFRDVPRGVVAGYPLEKVYDRLTNIALASRRDRDDQRRDVCLRG